MLLRDPCLIPGLGGRRKFAANQALLAPPRMLAGSAGEDYGAAAPRPAKDAAASRPYQESHCEAADPPESSNCWRGVNPGNRRRWIVARNVPINGRRSAWFSEKTVKRPNRPGGHGADRKKPLRREGRPCPLNVCVRTKKSIFLCHCPPEDHDCLGDFCRSWARRLGTRSPQPTAQGPSFGPWPPTVPCPPAPGYSSPSGRGQARCQIRQIKL